MFRRLAVRVVTCAMGLAYIGNGFAFFHNYRITELYSNADGSIQFVKLTNGNVDGEMFSAGVTMSVTAQGGSASHTFTFPANLPSPATANTSVLLATQGFANFGIVTPDFIVPAGFLFTSGGTVDLGGFDAVTYSALPTNGILSMNRNGSTAVNSPANFAGKTGTAPALALNLAAGWNLAGNGFGGTLNVATAFGDTTKVTTVWKWIAAKAGWAFYAPSLVGQALTDYATSKGYDVLTTVSGGEGFWVNAKTSFTAQLPAGAAITSASYQTGLAAGWNLIAIGDNRPPRQFNLGLSATPPAAGDIPLNLTTLWAWDAALTSWYFYAPSLEKNGGLLNYIQSKSYLDFGTKVLDPTMGFWVNKP